MKTLFRIFAICVVLFFAFVLAAYILVTRPSFQKNLIESKLPEGSSIKHVKIGPNQLELSEFKVKLSDGTSIRLEQVAIDFFPLDVVFNKTIHLGEVNVEGLVIELAEAQVDSTTNQPLPAGSVDGFSSNGPLQPTEPVELNGAHSPADVLYSLGQLDWLFDFESTTLSGTLVDASLNHYSIQVHAGAIAPGVETVIEGALQLQTEQALQGGVEDFSSEIEIRLKQNIDGGFEQVAITSQTSGRDQAGSNLLSIQQSLDLELDSFSETAVVKLSFDADLPNPEVFAPELVTLQGLSLKGAFEVEADGLVMTLRNAQMNVASRGQPVARIDLKQSLRLGAEQVATGELMQVQLFQLPLEWLNPWLTDELALSGAPLSANLLLSGLEGGALELRSLAPIQMGPLSLDQSGRTLLDDLSFEMQPVIRVDADQAIHYDLGDLRVKDRYGDVLSGTVVGQQQVTESEALFAGIQTKANLQIGLAELLQQPALADKAGVMAGQAQVVFEIDGASEYPAKMQSSVVGLRAREMPGTRQDYRLAAQLKRTDRGLLAIGANLEAGSENRPSTSVQITGQVKEGVTPIPFKLDITSPRVTQSDFDLLIAAAKSSAESPTSDALVANDYTPDSVSTASTSQMVSSERPAWADVDGTVNVSIDELRLASGHIIENYVSEATISEPIVALEQSASIGTGMVRGAGEILYSPEAAETYQLNSKFKLENLDPSVLSKKRSSGFPVSGLFDGSFEFTGAGDSLETAVEDSEGELTLTGRDGVLTAFELDNRSQIGLIGAGLLGQHLNRPGITALSQAVPYFKDMPFEKFSLKLTRAKDKQVTIPELSFVGESLRIEGNGSIAASGLGEVLKQPLDLTLQLGAKGKLVDYLETLQLLGPTLSEDGFRWWKQTVAIQGTLDDPDTDALTDLLNQAARRAIDKPKSKPKQSIESANTTNVDAVNEEVVAPEAVEPAQPKSKSKEERLLDDIEMGLDLFNSVLGN